MRSKVLGGGMNNSEPQNFGCGFDRGNPQPSCSSQPPSGSDLFVEAGRFAVEYLVSRGLLPSDVLPANLQNGVSTCRVSPNEQDTSVSKNNPGENNGYSPAIEVDLDKCPKGDSNLSSDVQHEIEVRGPLELSKPMDGSGACNDDQNIQNSENNNDGSTKEITHVTDVHSLFTDKTLKNEPVLISEEMKIGDTRHDTEIPSSNIEGDALCDQSSRTTRVAEHAHEQKSEFEMGGPIAKERGEKRALEEDLMIEEAKKPKQWLPVSQSSDFSDKKATSVEESMVPLPLKGGVEFSRDCGEEKQLLPSSYKICDLNLMDSSDKSEKHVRKDVENIDSMEDVKNSNSSMKIGEADTTLLEENVSNNSQHANANPDGQDGYGLMISELLANDPPNCSTVQPDINPLHNDMGLHHGEGNFSEDDPIYMSLGEIPLTGLIQDWEQEQPTQERNPFEQ